MLNVACVMAGDYLGCGAEYVAILHDAVRRNLPAGFRGRFVCFTDRPEALAALPGVEVRQLPSGLNGWWNKLYLFSSDAFKEGERVLYFDLDTCITGPLEDIAKYSGPFAALRDVYRKRDSVQSSVMAWQAGAMRYLWDRWNAQGRPEVEGGDQIWIERNSSPAILQDKFPGKLRSYKVDCVGGIPKGTSVVFFHGLPRPHEAGGWVPHVWKVGGGTIAELVNVGTRPQEEVLANIRSALAAGYPVLEPGEPSDVGMGCAVLCAGGPSLRDNLTLVNSLQMGGAAVFSANQVDGYLREKGITPNFHVMVDARPELEAWINPRGIKLYASMCAPSVLEKGAKVGDLTVWHPITEGVHEVIGDKGLIIGGGTTVGVRMLVLAWAMGFRRFLCFGYDSCYVGPDHHAYPQALNDGDRIIDAICAGRHFKCAPWMAQQAEDFKSTATALVKNGAHIQVYGDGLIAATLSQGSVERHSDIRARAILQQIKDVPNPQGVEVGVFAGDLSATLLKERSDLRLWMVDSWGKDYGTTYAASGDFHATLDAKQQAEAMQMAIRAVSFAAARATIMRQTSLEAAAYFANDSLDFVFIDADHSYEAVREDIVAWLPKVRPGGWLCGHDYAHPEYPHFGVQRAVDEAFGSSVELGENYTWFTRKPFNVTRTA